ncbi:unnamed protein product [Thelazia callipaeda]|uniref:Glycosyltransferase family 92 protein n=1 Tax=Thelazia callipaeda TaxID=103827 RepID=A0A0N5CQV2_THECL|nr:unnamed protein product [Thelazia callipaeda]
MSLRSGKSIRQLFFILVILVLLSTCWYALQFTLAVRYVVSHEASEETAMSRVMNNKNDEATLKEQVLRIWMEAIVIKNRIESYLAQIPSTIMDSLWLWWWKLFKKLDINKISVHTNVTSAVTEDTLFIYKAFLDQRKSEEPLIRVLAFGQCREIQVLLRYGKFLISVKEVTVEYHCPWQWAPYCKWFSFMLVFSLSNTNFSTDTDHIFLMKRNQIITVPLKILPQQYEDTLHVCVPPLYWYWNYVALIQFIEIWSKQGATVFHIYYVSVNQHTMDILKIYERMGIIRLIRWQMLPRSDLTDPNRWIYRFGHTLSMNDCLYTSTAKYVALVDTDEFIIPNSGTLLPFLREAHNLNGLAGSFVFEHAKVRFPGWKEFELQPKLDFFWLKNAEFHLQRGPSKTVFMPERVQIIVTHTVREFLKPYKPFIVWIFPFNLFHCKFFSLKLFQQYVSLLNTKYQILMSKVPWPEQNLIPCWKDHSKTIEGCLSKWRLYGCKAPYHLCVSDLHDKDEWIFSHVNVSSDYILF